jgi:hypothetical protein
LKNEILSRIEPYCADGNSFFKTSLFQLHADSDDDEETDLQANLAPINNGDHSTHHHHANEIPHRTRNLVIYHLINDFSTDLIYGCGLSTALAHDRLVGSVLCLLIFSEGFRRHSRKQEKCFFYRLK